MKILTTLTVSGGLNMASNAQDSFVIGTPLENNDSLVDNLTVYANANFTNKVILGSSSFDTITANGPITASSGISSSAFIGDGSGLINLPLSTYTTATQLTSSKSSLGNFDALQYFGDGSDGSVTISAGTTTLTKNMYYNNLTITGGAIVTAGWAIFVSGVLDISTAPAAAIQSNPNNAAGSGGTGSPGGGSAGHGAAPNDSNVVDAKRFVQGSNRAGGGGAGTTTTGGNGTTIITTPNMLVCSQTCALGGAGGSGLSGSGGTGGPTTAVSSVGQIRRYVPNIYHGSGHAWGGIGGTGGGGGGGDGTNAGRGGGGAGAGGGIIYISADTILRGGSTAASCIQAKGGNGGLGGGNGSISGVGGGGGGGAGAGGTIIIYYAILSGSTGTNILDVSGGTGGNGGTGGTGATGGTGGQGGCCGSICALNITTGVISTLTSGVTGSTPSAPTGTAGTTGGAGASGLLSL